MKGHKLSRVFPVTIALLAMLVLMGPTLVHAQGTVVSISDATLEPGEEVTLAINITDITDVGAINIWLYYNPSTVTIPDGGIAAGDMGVLAASSIDNTSGIAKMTWFDAYGQTGSFVFANVTFKAGATAGNCALDIQVQELVDISLDSIPYTEDDGVFAVNAPPPSGGGGGGGGGGAPQHGPELEVDMMGRVASGPITEDGELEETINVTSRDGVVTLRLPEGTVALDSEGNRLEEITVDPVLEPPSLPEKWYVSGMVYDFSPDGATFDGSVEFTVGYDPEELPERVNGRDLAIGYYHSDSQEWRLLPSVVDTGAHTVTSSIGHFTVFAVIGRTAPAFTLSNLSISTSEVDRGEGVTISVEVTNAGGIEGSYIGTLLIDGFEEATQERMLEPGASDTFIFTVSMENAGTYEATMDGLSGSFTVTEEEVFPWWAVGLGAGLGALLLATVMAYLLNWRRRRALA